MKWWLLQMIFTWWFFYVYLILSFVHPHRRRSEARPTVYRYYTLFCEDIIFPRILFVHWIVYYTTLDFIWMHWTFLGCIVLLFDVLYFSCMFKIFEWGYVKHIQCTHFLVSHMLICKHLLVLTCIQHWIDLYVNLHWLHLHIHLLTSLAYLH